jgi:GAF domain-containing protein
MQRENRSVVDYDNEDDLRNALLEVRRPEQTHHPYGYENTALEQSHYVPSYDASLSQRMDWVLPSFDIDTTEVQSMKEELHRLMVLKSYLILDAEHEEAFERITGIAARIFNVPIALVSLVDLGRQWFMSNRGLGDVRETPRKFAFCAHAILSKHNILIVPDATRDYRFMNNPLVTGPPDIRFYAGTN